MATRDELVSAETQAKANRIAVELDIQPGRDVANGRMTDAYFARVKEARRAEDAAVRAILDFDGIAPVRVARGGRG